MHLSPIVRPLAAALALAASTAAQAQARPTAKPTLAPAPAPAPAAVVPLPPPPVFTPAPAPVRAALAREEGDGARAMGSWALVVFNTQPFDFPNTGGAAPLPLTIYTVGLRRWTTEPLGPFRNWGYDLGIGLNYSRSSITQPQTGTLTTTDGPSTSGFGLHAGLPLAITLHQHAVFELVPEADIIWAKETIPALTSASTTRYSGYSARLGARAGFEIFFGSIGLPQLAIEASLGAALNYGSVTSSIGAIERSTRQWGFSTLRGKEPWSIFTGSVAAMYHF
jgi:hypothetical protein